MKAAVWLGHPQQAGAQWGLLDRKLEEDQMSVLGYFCYESDFYILKVHEARDS